MGNQCPSGYTTQVCNIVGNEKICVPTCQRMGQECKMVAECAPGYVKHKIDGNIDGIPISSFEICNPIIDSNGPSMSNVATDAAANMRKTIINTNPIHNVKENFDMVDVRNTCNKACGEINLVHILILILIIILLYLVFRKNKI